MGAPCCLPRNNNAPRYGQVPRATHSGGRSVDNGRVQITLEPTAAVQEGLMGGNGSVMTDDLDKDLWKLNVEEN